MKEKKQSSLTLMAAHPHSTLGLDWFGCETSDIVLPAAEVKDQSKHL
jgi:hypothetical protein